MYTRHNQSKLCNCMDSCAPLAVAGKLLGQQVWIAAIDDLLIMKRIANRPKDRLDIEALQKVKRGEDPNV